MRRRHRPCRLQEGDICPVALPVRRRHRGVSPSSQSGVPDILLPGTSPKQGKHYTRGRGACLSCQKAIKHTNHPRIPQEHGFYAWRKPHSHEHGVLTLLTPNHKKTTSRRGRGACLGREDRASLPPREERTRLGLLVGLVVSSSRRTARTRPLHEQSDTLLSTAASTRGRHPKNAGTPRGRERERGKGEARERGEGLGCPGFKPAVLRRRHTPVSPSFNQKATVGMSSSRRQHTPRRKTTDNGQISEFEKSEGDSHLVAFTRHRQSHTDTKDVCHVCPTASGATQWEGDTDHVAFQKATYPMSQSQIEPDTDACHHTTTTTPTLRRRLGLLLRRLLVLRKLLLLLVRLVLLRLWELLDLLLVLPSLLLTRCLLPGRVLILRWLLRVLYWLLLLRSLPPRAIPPKVAWQATSVAHWLLTALLSTLLY
ncbi:hypothetical protein Taro_000795 [Colocasia esculenta]|uniref:Uncharacterized protein n=1 Tax=Colocasia esculenta TaxID=4460 RepID=A0A843TBZ5_COLES|nr:hypothetical protein [Colocasia esculenta]